MVQDWHGLNASIVLLAIIVHWIRLNVDWVIILLQEPIYICLVNEVISVPVQHPRQPKWRTKEGIG